ncbi:hypothetical protein OSG_eHP32_00185 [environmental Halophage eHP-32]|nr:hypothetical protein OSG_eHP32_00185 [environmental Halophage eHP-32]
MSDDVPEPPFSAGKPRESSSYHTTRCQMVERAQPQRVRHLTDNEVRYHDLTKCPFCRVEAGETDAATAFAGEADD